MQLLRVSMLSTLAVLTPQLLQAQNVVTEWNAIASQTIVANGGKASSPRESGSPIRASQSTMP